MNPYTDKYFTKSKKVARIAGLNPVVRYRIFTRFDGIAALEPMARLITELAVDAKVEALPTGTAFKAGETIAIVTGRFQDLVELETQWLQFTALPCYCASESRKIVERAGDKMVMDFAARHLFDPVSCALASYGAEVGGIPSASTDVGANALGYLGNMINFYKGQIDICKLDIAHDKLYPKPGVGTTPHALLAIFKGNYCEMAEAYIEAYPNDKFVGLIDYNNEEVTDSLRLLELLREHLAGVRIDTCGENHAQIGYDQDGSPKYDTGTGVTTVAVRALKSALVNNGGDHVKLFVSSGFNADKVGRFMETCPSSIDGIGTGSFIPKVPTATADIFEVDGKKESKAGREWGYEANDKFWHKRFSKED